jgi:uncharacterized membrane protein YhaH (DUF805 family)
MATFSEKYFSFHGRLRRSQYWLYHLVQWAVLIATVLAVSGLMQAAGSDSMSPALAVPLGIAGIVLYVGLVWSSLSVSVRRCHDRNKSGWFLLVSLIPLVGLWVIVELGFLDGTQGPNQYGPSPKGIGGNEVAGVFS